MVMKAILTGGVLSVLAGSIVYFGTEGADALERDSSADVRLDEMELAGAAESTADKVDSIIETPAQKDEERKAKAEARKAKARADAKALAEAKAKSEANVNALAEDPETEEDVVAMSVEEDTSPTETQPGETSKKKPKTRWLDQYLKSDKKKAPKLEANSEEIEVAVENTDDALVADKIEVETEVDVETAVEGLRPVKKMLKKKVIVKMDGDKKMVWSSDDAGEMDDSIDMKMIESLLGEELDIDPNTLSDSDVNIRVIRKDEIAGSRRGQPAAKHKTFDYDAILDEAKKLQVVDMRNQAFLEIVDYAVDRGDFGNAADIVEELSSPELRDTARSRIGVGLANRGDMEAAFAVLEEIEIDELAAPIRLEIIAALMATRAERDAPMMRR